MQAPVCASAFAGRLLCRVRRMMPRARPRWNAILCITNGCGRLPALGVVAPASSATRSCKHSTGMHHTLQAQHHDTDFFASLNCHSMAQLAALVSLPIISPGLHA